MKKKSAPLELKILATADIVLMSIVLLGTTLFFVGIIHIGPTEFAKNIENFNQLLFLSIASFIISIARVISSIGLFFLKEWARLLKIYTLIGILFFVLIQWVFLQTITNQILLIAFCAYMIWYLSQPEIVKLFSRSK